MPAPEPNVAAPPSNKKTFWAWTAGTWFGVGMVGKGGGTVASVVSVGIWAVLARSSMSESHLTMVMVALAVFTTLIGIPAGTIVARELGKKDPSEVVIDEVAGQAIALIAIPLNWKYAIASLILFRAFDIIKPPPVRQLEALPGGTGIMMDDVAAGILALILVQVSVRFHFFG